MKYMNVWDVDDDVDEEFSLQIDVFKSRAVSVSNCSCIFIFNLCRNQISLRALDSDVVKMRKCYSESTMEFVIVGTKSNKIYVFNVAYLFLIVACDG